MNTSTEPTLETLRAMFHYEPTTGTFMSRRTGRKVGWANCRGYIGFTVAGRSLKAHRLAWLYVYGAWPESEIDHINGDKTDNRIANLRVTTRALNVQNLRRPRADNKLGVLGVSRKKDGRFVAQIRCDGKPVHTLGSFKTAEAAHAAYLAAKRNVHPGNTL